MNNACVACQCSPKGFFLLNLNFRSEVLIPSRNILWHWLCILAHPFPTIIVCKFRTPYPAIPIHRSYHCMSNWLILHMCCGSSFPIDHPCKLWTNTLQFPWLDLIKISSDPKPSHMSHFNQDLKLSETFLHVFLPSHTSQYDNAYGKYINGYKCHRDNMCKWCKT